MHGELRIEGLRRNHFGRCAKQTQWEFRQARSQYADDGPAFATETPNRDTLVGQLGDAHGLNRTAPARPAGAQECRARVMLRARVRWPVAPHPAAAGFPGGSVQPGRLPATPGAGSRHTWPRALRQLRRHIQTACDPDIPTARRTRQPGFRRPAGCGRRSTTDAAWAGTAPVRETRSDTSDTARTSDPPASGPGS